MDLNNNSITTNTSHTIELNIAPHIPVLKIIQKALKTNSSNHITFTIYDNELFIYSESGITNMQLIYKITLSHKIVDFNTMLEEFGFSDGNGIPNVQSTNNKGNNLYPDEAKSFTVNRSFIDSLIMLKAPDITIEFNNEIVRVRTSTGTQISFTNLRAPTLLEDYYYLLKAEFTEVIDIELVNVIIKSLISLKEDNYKKYIGIDRNNYYTNNNNYIIESKSVHRCTNHHLLTYTMLDTIRTIPKDLHSLPNIKTDLDENYTLIKYKGLIIKFDNLGIERFERLSDVLNYSAYEPFVTLTADEIQKIKLLSLGGTVDEYDEIQSEIITIDTTPNTLITNNLPNDKKKSNELILCTKGRTNIAVLKGHTASSHKIKVNGKNLINAVFMAGSKNITLLVDKMSQQETLVVQGKNTKVLIGLDSIQ